MNRKLKNEELSRVSVEEYKEKKKLPVVIVLDGIRSMHNVGAVFRTADAFCVEKILLCGITPQPPHREIQKTALGATESVDWAHFPETIDCIKRLKEDGYVVYCVEQAEQSLPLEQLVLNKGDKIALIFGNEVKGVAQNVIDCSDGVLEIPQEGTKHSLNISVSTGIVTWEVFKQLWS